MSTHKLPIPWTQVALLLITLFSLKDAIAEEVVYPSYPDNFIEEIKALAVEDLYDPHSAILTYGHPVKAKCPLESSDHHYGAYVIGFTLNAKNRMGGYTGAETMFAIYIDETPLLAANSTINRCELLQTMEQAKAIYDKRIENAPAKVLAEQGKKYSQEAIFALVPGVSTMEEAKRTVGMPVAAASAGQAGTVWTWQYTAVLSKAGKQFTESRTHSVLFDSSGKFVSVQHGVEM